MKNRYAGGVPLLRALTLILASVVVPVTWASPVFYEEFDGEVLDTHIHAGDPDYYNPNSRWIVGNWLGAGFKAVDWQPGHVSVGNGTLKLVLDRTGDDGRSCPDGCARDGGSRAFAGGHLLTRERFGTGVRVAVRMKAPAGDGLVTGAFRYANASGDEVDFEFLGKDPGTVQLNYFIGGQGVVEHERYITRRNSTRDDSNAVKILAEDYRFTDFHTYAFEAVDSVLRWYIDGQQVHQVDVGQVLDEGQVRLELWSPVEGSPTDTYWAGHFEGQRAVAEYDWVRITAVPLPPAWLLFGGAMPLLLRNRRGKGGTRDKR